MGDLSSNVRRWPSQALHEPGVDSSPRYSGGGEQWHGQDWGSAEYEEYTPPQQEYHYQYRGRYRQQRYQDHRDVSPPAPGCGSKSIARV